MGNPHQDGAPDMVRAAAIHTFYSEQSWIEGSAVEQLTQVASLQGVQSIAAFPDLHPGKYGPVGCAIMADRIHPHLIGNDIGCGMSLFALDIPSRKLRIDKAALKLRCLEGFWDGDISSRLQQVGLAPNLHSTALGTIGGGNHFCELQSLATVFDDRAVADAGLSKDSILLLVHSGSRSLGTQIFGRVQHHFNGLEPDSPEANAYLKAHHEAVTWAKLNRAIIAERAAIALRSQCQLIADAPHNLVERVDDDYLHRKGAAKADAGLVPLAGSRDALSFLVKPSGGVPDALHSLAHGSGRKYDRRSMMGRVGATKSGRERLERTSFGGRVVCEDRQLLIEEAPGAYKDSQQVMDELVSHGLVTNVAALKPLLTFKKANENGRSERQNKQKRLSQRRRDR